MCACSRTYGASSRGLGVRNASCDILLSALQQLRLLRVLLRTSAAGAAAVAAVAVYCHRFFKVDLPEAANNPYVRKKKGPTGRMLASGPVQQGFESTWGQVLVFFLRLFFAY